jgi:hypothetical protein
MKNHYRNRRIAMRFWMPDSEPPDGNYYMPIVLVTRSDGERFLVDKDLRVCGFTSLNGHFHRGRYLIGPIQEPGAMESQNEYVQKLKHDLERQIVCGKE